MLAEVVVPGRVGARAGERIFRVLSAGCASGEEAYSLAIQLREAPELSGWNVEIFGIDVNPAALARARAAEYAVWALRDTPAVIRERWFQPDGRGGFRLDEHVRRSVSFEVRNLLEDDAAFLRPGRFDAVFCRNVLMYFAPEAARAVVERLARALAPAGYLFLGHAETLRGVSQAFHLRHTHGTFYYERREGPSAPRELLAPLGAAAAPPPPAVPEPADSWVDTIQAAARRIEDLARGRVEARSAADSPIAPSPRRAPPPPPVRLRRAWELVQAERFSDALDELGALAPDEEIHVDALLLRAALLTNTGDLAEAERVCARVIAADDLSAGARYLMALCREHAGDRAGAVDQDQYASYLDPSFAMPHLHLGLMARRAGDPVAARRELGQALSLLEREDAARILMFGGGFTRAGLLALCRAGLRAVGGAR